MKIGYTLAEVLITLGIIGVISAMTIPSMVNNVQNQVCAKALSATISDFETGMSILLAKENVFSLRDTEAWSGQNTMNIDSSDAIIERFSRNVGFLKPIDQDYERFYGAPVKGINGEESSLLEDFIPFEISNGAVAFMIIGQYLDGDEVTILRSGGNLSKVAATVFIDVNGKKKPNIIGRDIFAFLLGTDAKLYPYGGKDATVYSGNNSLAWQTQCSDNGAKGAEGMFCTARLIENGYKMDY